MPYYFACPPAVHTRLGFCALAVRTDTVSGTTGAFHFAIFTIRAGNSASLSGGVGVERGWNGETLRANSLQEILHFFFFRICHALCPFFVKQVLFFFSPICHLSPASSPPAAQS